VIPLTRGAVRSFLAVARRLAPRRGGPLPRVRLAAEPGTVTLTAHAGPVVVGRRVPANTTTREEVLFSLDDLSRLGGRGDDPLTLEVTGPAIATARWGDAGGPHQIQLPLIVESPRTWPTEPRKLLAASPEFPAAMHEAGRVAAREAPGRYALDHVQVRGKVGQVNGTDGRQALSIGGFTFPFADDLLVPATPVFGAKEIAREAALSIGLARDWLYVLAGPWQVWVAIDRTGRFPDVAGAVPKAVISRATFADADAERLLAELPRLSGKGEEPRPVTLDLDAGRVTGRARDDESQQTTEVPLGDSTSAGRPVLVVLSRAHFGRALAVGCRELAISAPDRPAVFRGPGRCYLTVPLDPKLAVPPTETADRSVLPRSPEPDRRPTVPAHDMTPAEKNGHADPPPADGFDPIAEAEALKAALAEAAARAARLVAALKSYRRERRSLQKLASQYLSLHR
jgi:hypothetical protein